MTSVRAADGPGFRPDLEGLRAVAVVLVLLYHAGVPGVAGGYIGVDVFFVLSGFLITGLLIRELGATGRISLPAFYARRARRLLPASALVLAVTAVASAVMLPPLRMPDVAGDIAAAAGYVSNMRFAFQATDYLASELAPSPVLHFWSLGVEEQFYVFWPAMLALAAGAAFAAGDLARGIRRVTVTLAVVFVSSLVLAVWLTGVQQPWAFFSLPTRAWELALGGLLAVPAAARLIPPRLAPLMAWAGLGLVVYAGMAFDELTAFPGTAALIPTVGSALVIAAGLRPVTAAAAPGVIPGPAPLLALPPVRFLGRISYSLYLWHWPILVLPAAAFGDLPGLVRLLLAGASILVAWASQRWVEEPFRRGRIVGTKPARNLALAGVTTVVVVVGALGVGAWSQRNLTPPGEAIGGTVDEVPLPTTPPIARPTGEPGATPAPSPVATPTPTIPPLAAAPVPADLVPSLGVARDDIPVIYDDGCHVDQASVTSPDCVYGEPASAKSIVLFGDSHAAQWFPAVERLADEQGWRMVNLTKSACASADVEVWNTIYKRPYTECTAWREAAFERIERERPAIVLVANSRNYDLVRDGEKAAIADEDEIWDAGLARTVDRLVPLVDQVVVLGDTARMREDPPVCLSSNLEDITACSTPRETAIGAERLASDRRIAERGGAAFVDPTPWQCFTEPCPPVIGRFLVYRDTHHMTATYARALSSRLLAQLAVPDGSATNRP